VILVSALPTMIHLAKEYGPSARRLVAERLNVGGSREALAPVRVEVDGEGMEMAGEPQAPHA
jgi:hypothetical protein